ncbi:MAG: [Fe-Fe] hydrogenase large subunit C-terminal domain-containing protein [Planctomycetia bacterium]|nr:[Fe-Fe] hydrogenase large subunit C-terminal domain-containing protein [Planctomycetia bacterium]
MKKQNKMNRRDLLKTGVSALGLSLIPSGSLFAQRGMGGGGMGRGRGGHPIPVDPANPAIAFNENRCEQCSDCRSCCSGYMGVLDENSGSDGSHCIHCGQCTLICQGQALTEQYDYPQVSALLDSKDKILIASIAPSVRVSIGEMFGLLAGRDIEGKLIQGLRTIGFDYVLDTCFSADITIMEEAAELVHHLKNGEGGKPLFTGCCPAWKKYAQLYYPQWAPSISKVKSPFMIQAALVKSWFAQKMNLEPEKIVHVGIAPCTAKKYELTLPGMGAASRFRNRDQSVPDLDYSLTTRETGMILKSRGVSRLLTVDNGSFDPMMGETSGAGLIFGNSGGVMQAALRTAYWIVNKKDPPAELMNWEPASGVDPIRTAKVDLGSRSLRVAVVHGTGYLPEFFGRLENGEKFDFVEVMACPYGCIGGGGQPRTVSSSYEALCNRRKSALIKRDEESSIRLSYKNTEVAALYKQFLKEPLSDRSRQLLHLK